MYAEASNQLSFRFSSDEIEDIFFFRSIAQEIDKNPRLIENYYHVPSIVENNEKMGGSCYDLVRRSNVLAYGDVGVYLARPGPSLSGVIVSEAGSIEQKDMYFKICQSRKRKTFFAMTEPAGGSQISTIKTKIVEVTDGVVFSGEKCFVGGGAVADLGVVIAKREKGNNLITLILTDKELNSLNSEGLPAVKRYLLPMVGLKGAEYSHLIFDKCFVPNEKILGYHLNSLKNGTIAVLKTFNLRRPFIAAITIGMAQSVLDYYNAHAASKTKKYKKDILLQFQQRISLLQIQIYECAKKVDQNPLISSDASSVKFKAINLLESLMCFCINNLGALPFLNHPILEKWYRDAFALEFLEGSTPIQKENIYSAYVNENKKLAL